MTEKEVLMRMVRRLEKAGQVCEIEYREDEHALYYRSNGWHAYSIRFVFDDSDQVIATAAGC
jgi:hypothetical protein